MVADRREGIRELGLSQREFRLEVDLPAREVRVRVETVDGSGRRAGRTVANVFGLPRSARPRIRTTRFDAGLQTDVRRLATGFPGAAAVYVENLGTGAAAAWNARATFPAASTLKLAIAVTALSRVDACPPGTSLDSLLRQMLDASDNEAANRSWSLGGRRAGSSWTLRCARSASSGR